MICYLLLAHHQPDHLERLVTDLTAHGDKAVVHLDARRDPKAFEAARSVTGVTFVTEPTRVMWAGWSLVDATLKTLNEAMVVAPDASHYQLMSGDGYPLRSPVEIRRWLESRPGENFLNLLPMPAETVDKPIDRLSRYWIEHDPRTTRVGKVYSFVRRFSRRNVKKHLEGMRPFCGSQWFCLNASAATFLLSEVERRPRFVRFCRHSQVPDEHFIHTLLGNSSFAETVQPSVHFADFKTTLGMPSPATLDEKYISYLATNELRITDAYGEHELLWARKFPNDSHDLLREVQDVLWTLNDPPSNNAAQARSTSNPSRS